MLCLLLLIPLMMLLAWPVAGYMFEPLHYHDPGCRSYRTVYLVPVGGTPPHTTVGTGAKR
jgi:hypothetical protein